jgi:hypothetical protein
MRGLVLFVVFFAAIPFIFFNGPFFGILIWYWVSLMNPQKLVWNSFAGGIPYAHIVAVLTLLDSSKNRLFLIANRPLLGWGMRGIEDGGATGIFR